MNKHQKQHVKDQTSYAKFIKKHGAEPSFMGTNEDEKIKFHAAHKKWVVQWNKWSNE